MCCVFRFGVVCVVFIVSGCRKEKNERHFAWLLIALLVCHNLIHVCDCFSLVFVWHLSLFFWQYAGAIYIAYSDLTFEGSATFTSCSAEASGSSDSSFADGYIMADAVSGGE